MNLVTGLRKGRCPTFDPVRHWRRALLQAVLAQHLGAKERVAPPSECFVLGLLWDSGSLLVVECDPTACALARDAGDRLRQVLREHGYTPMLITAALMAWLGFPAVFLDAVCWQAAREANEPSEVPLRSRRIAELLALSEAAATAAFATGAGPSSETFATLTANAQALHLSLDEIDTLLDQVWDEWQDWCRLIELGESPQHRGDRLAKRLQPENRRETPLSIVVVDDDPVLRRMSERFLTAAGHQVFTFANGQTALSWLREHSADAVIVDLLLGEEDGWSLIEALRALPRGQRLHIIVLSVLNDMASIRRAFEVGADDYLTKPFDALMVETRLMPAQRKKMAFEGTASPEAAPLIDPTTHLFTRAYLLQRLEQELALAYRLGRPLALLLLRFPSGENLNALALSLQQWLRASDVIGEWDEQTLWLLLPNTPETGVLRLLERLAAWLGEQQVRQPVEAFSQVDLLLDGTDDAAPQLQKHDWSAYAARLLTALSEQPTQLITPRTASR
jgi:DNA-binding response OmpR family regulator